MKKILHLAPSDSIGGSSIATYRVHQAISSISGITSTMLVNHKSSDDCSVITRSVRHSYIKARAREALISFKMRKSLQQDHQISSIAWPKTNIIHHPLIKQADIIQLHWIGNHLISIEEIGSINKPIVWRFADMWPILGCKHYSDSLDLEPPITLSSQSKYRFLDVDRWTYERKKAAWKIPMNIVCTTTWMQEQLSKSLIMSNWSSTVIPNCIDTKVFKPIDQQYARKILNFPVESRIVLFGAIGGLHGDPRKGGDLLLKSLSALANRSESGENFLFATFGSSENGIQDQYDINSLSTINAGRINDDVHLSLLYSACDVMVVPSRQESFGQTAMEAQACGVPVVAFRIGGLQCLIEDGVTGHLCNPFDTDEMAFKIGKILFDRPYRDLLSFKSRERACELWSQEAVAQQYNRLYDSIIDRSHDFH
jgi:glycosyltransferase involved in cell wall biosynthesis